MNTPHQPPPSRTLVVIPTYNRGGMVVEAARSALAQSAAPRVVVVDDGSTDDTVGRLSALGGEPDAHRLMVVRQENRERGAARNRGAREWGESEFLLFLDADDALLPDHTALLEHVADAHPGAPMVASAGVLCDDALTPRGRIGGGARSISLPAFLAGREPLAPSLTLIRRSHFEAVGGFEEDRTLAGSEDWHLTARLLTRGMGYRHGEPTVKIRRHPGNTMADPERMLRSMLEAHHRFFHPPTGAPWVPPDDLVDPARSVLLVQAATQFYAAGAGAAARARLREALRTHPPVLLNPLWGWTWLRSFLPAGVSRRLREGKESLKARRSPGA